MTINSSFFRCALLVCERDPATCIPHDAFRTQHAFDSIHTTHLLFSSAYTSNVHVSSISDKAVGVCVFVCVCVQAVRSQDFTHLSILLVQLHVLGGLPVLSAV